MGLAHLDELSIHVNSTGRRIEDLSASLTLEIGETTAAFGSKLEEVHTTLATTSNTVAEFQSSLRQVEANTSAIREMQTAMESMCDNT